MSGRGVTVWTEDGVTTEMDAEALRELLARAGRVDVADDDGLLQLEAGDLEAVDVPVSFSLDAPPLLLAQEPAASQRPTLRSLAPMGLGLGLVLVAAGLLALAVA